MCPGDTPLLSTHLVKALAQALEQDGRPAAIAHDGNKAQHLFLLLRCASAASIESYVQSGKRKVLGWVQSMDPSVLDFSDEAESFTNVNTRADLKRLEKRLRVMGLRA